MMTMGTFLVVTEHQKLVHRPTISLSALLIPLERSRRSVNTTQIMTIVR